MISLPWAWGIFFSLTLKCFVGNYTNHTFNSMFEHRCVPIRCFPFKFQLLEFMVFSYLPSKMLNRNFLILTLSICEYILLYGILVFFSSLVSHTLLCCSILTGLLSFMVSCYFLIIYELAKILQFHS